MKSFNILVIIGIFLCPWYLTGQENVKQGSVDSYVGSKGDSHQLPQLPLIAKKEKEGGDKKSGRERHITREAGTKKGGDASRIDFGETSIEGERRVPLGTLINQNDSDKNYDFVKIRQRWHDEMVQSAGTLNTGAANQ